MKALFASIIRLGRKPIELLVTPSEPTTVNGLVNIVRSLDDGKGIWHFAQVHVHPYATNVIGNELRRIHRGSPGIHEAELCLEFDAEPSIVVGEEDLPRRIVFRYVDGPFTGRMFDFTPVFGDTDGWKELVAYAKQLIDDRAFQKICMWETRTVEA